MCDGYIFKLELSEPVGGQDMEKERQGGIKDDFWIGGMSHWVIGGIIYLAGEK